MPIEHGQTEALESVIQNDSHLHPWGRSVGGIPPAQYPPVAPRPPSPPPRKKTQNTELFFLHILILAIISVFSLTQPRSELA